MIEPGCTFWMPKSTSGSATSTEVPTTAPSELPMKPMRCRSKATGDPDPAATARSSCPSRTTRTAEATSAENCRKAPSEYPANSSSPGSAPSSPKTRAETSTTDVSAKPSAPGTSPRMACSSSRADAARSPC